MKTLLPVYVIFAFICLNNCDNSGKANNNSEKVAVSDSLSIADSIEHLRMFQKANEAFAYCSEHKFNITFCLLVNMHAHSGLTRFYVWDFTAKKAIDSGLVSHGCGPNLWGHDDSKTNPVFSNVYESHCSSLGKYKIGERGYSNWGIHVNYAMHGLDSTNSNSFGRQICMHSWDMVGDVETFPEGTPEGWGCAAVSDSFMRRLDNKLKSTDKPVLMWIFY